MEAKRSKTGNKRYSREMKRRAVEKREENNWTWKETQAWVKKTFNQDIPYGSIIKWAGWYTDEKLGVTGGSSAEIPNGKNPNWNQHEIQELKLGIELGLTAQEIAECMNEDEELNYRRYTVRGIEAKKLREGLTKELPHPNSIGKKETVEEQLEQMEMSLVKYRSALNVEVKCNKCGYQWVRGQNNIKNKAGCPTCILPPNSYHEVYVIEFCNFGNPSVKVGISADYYSMRRKSFPEHKVIEVYPTTFKEAKEIENLTKEKYGIYRTTPPELQGNGITECYDISQTELINETIKEQLYG
jgi:predicted Zn-ribbon and HTH transcriptional regulator